MNRMVENSFYPAFPEKEIKDSFSIRKWNNYQFDDLTINRISYNKIFLIKEGSGFVQIDGTVYPLAGNAIFLLAKGQIYGFQSRSRASGFELSFGDCFWEKAPASASNCKAVLFNNAEANQHLSISSDQAEQIRTLFHALYEEYESAEYVNKPDALAAYLKIIMIKIANVNASLSQGYSSYEAQLYRQFLELVSQQFKSTHEVAEFASQLGIPARKLTDFCKQCSGKGAKDIINGQLIAEAKRSLQFSSKSVKEIAYYLHFSTPDQFSHFFKKATSLSPYQYRSHFVEIGM